MHTDAPGRTRGSLISSRCAGRRRSAPRGSVEGLPRDPGAEDQA